MNRKALIIGVKGLALTNEEIQLLKVKKPWGVILFSRNIRDILQLKSLISMIKNSIKDKKYPILIDQEGGSVSRLNKIIDLSLFSQDHFGRLYKENKINFLHYYKIYIDKVCDILRNVGININTVPVLDVRRKYTHKIIVNRSFSSDSATVSKIGKLCIDLYKKNKIATVIKHIPGHGLSKCDSHYHLPVIKSKKRELIKKDFRPFKECESLFAMTAHVVYSIYDPIYPATHSKIIIEDVIRKYIGFKGLLISDDISMKALKYGLKDNTIKALNAGCNLIMHCNGNINEMRELTKIVPMIDKFTQEKTSHFSKLIG